MRTERARCRRWGPLLTTVLLGLSLLGSALPAGRVMAASAGRIMAAPARPEGAPAAVGRPLGQVALPAGLRAALRRALGPRARADGPSAPTPIVSWNQQAEPTASDGAAGDVFGYAVAVSGNTALVGAWGKNGSTGAAYAFVRSGSTWSQQQELTASDGASRDGFGYSVAVSGGTALVGAPGNNGSTGAAYAFVRAGGVASPTDVSDA